MPYHLQGKASSTMFAKHYLHCPSVQTIHAQPKTRYMAATSLWTSRKNLKTNLLQVDCQNLLSTVLLQVAFTSCNKSANERCNKSTCNTLFAT